MRRRWRFWKASDDSFLRVHNSQRSVKNRQADGFRFGDVRSMSDSAWREEKSASGMSYARFFPLPRENINKFVCVRMNVGGNGHAGVEFAEDSHAAGLFVFVEKHEFDAGIRARLPLLIFGRCDVRKHWDIETRSEQKARTEAITSSTVVGFARAARSVASQVSWKNRTQWRCPYRIRGQCSQGGKDLKARGTCPVKYPIGRQRRERHIMCSCRIAIQVTFLLKIVE